MMDYLQSPQTHVLTPNTTFSTTGANGIGAEYVRRLVAAG